MRVQVRDSASNFRPLLDFYEQLRADGKTIEHLTFEKKNEYQLMAVNVILEHVWNNNEHYRNAMTEVGMVQPRVDSLAELSRLPFLVKDIIRGDKTKLLSCPPGDLGQIHVTTGTTGKPIYTAYSFSDQFVYDLLPVYSVLFPDDDTDVLGVALPYELAFPGLGFQRLYQFMFGATVLSLGKGGYTAPMDKSLELMQTFKVTLLATTPSYAALLAEEAEKLGIDIKKDIPIKRIILTGEGCSNSFRDRLEQTWGCEVSFFYGSTEAGVVGIECHQHNGYHVAEGHVHVEIIDTDTYDVLDYGETGEIVVTTLLREGMPFIRYRTGDIGFKQQSTCKCGLSMDKLHLRGRKESQLTFGGEDYSPFLIEHFLLQVPEVGMWFHLRVRGEQLTIEVEPFRSQISEQELVNKVKQHMFETIGLACDVVVKDHLPRTFGKAKRVFFD